MFLRLLICIFAFTSINATNNYVFFSPEMISSHLKKYNEEEKAAIDKDLLVIRSICFDHAQPVSSRPPIYLATVGAPGARKTTILERFIVQQPEYQNAVYLDPDSRTLRFMVHTYYQSLNNLMIASSENYSELLKGAYNKWRSGSNYIALTLLEEAFQQGADIVHGTTSTGSHIPRFLPKVKEAGYQVILLLCSCDDDLRKNAIEYRENEIRFCQSTMEDAIAKGQLFCQRMSDYFQYADKIYFIWSNELLKPERVAAVLDGKTFEIRDLDAYVRFVGQYELDRKQIESQDLELQLPSFDELLTRRTEAAH